MKTWLKLVLGFNWILIAFMFYHAMMHGFVYFANKAEGHQESPRSFLTYLLPGLVMLSLTLGGIFLNKNVNQKALASFLICIPLGIGLLFLLWTLIIILSSGGKWN